MLVVGLVHKTVDMIEHLNKVLDYRVVLAIVAAVLVRSGRGRCLEYHVDHVLFARQQMHSHANQVTNRPPLIKNKK